MQVCQLQQEFGKRGEDFETMVKGFLWVLEDYRMPVILDALKEHIRSKTTIPTPADLVNLIDPPEQPLSAAVYVAYQKRAKEGHFLLSDERAYCRAYEAQEMGKVRGGSSEYREAQQEINDYSRRLAIGYDGDHED
jgi:hypothetical protein